MQSNWQEFVQQEISFFTPILKGLGFEIDIDQPHTKGERGSFRAKKIILLGRRISYNFKVVIKCARYEEGIKELQEEKQARENIKKIDFAYHEFLEPKEILFRNEKMFLIQVTEFIVEEKKFLDRDPNNQFDIAYRSLITQEGIHAVTSKHNKTIKKLFTTFDFNTYRHNLSKFKIIISDFLLSSGTGALGPLIKGPASVRAHLCKASEVGGILDLAENEFLQNKHRIQQYSGFLTHTDFVPHNFRVRNDNGVERVYLLDHSAIIIGNKHDGWARFLNFCVLHSPIVEKWFTEYFKVNRSKEESESLRLMRIYRLFELVTHHVTIYKNTNEVENKELKELSKKRVFFWLELLQALYENRELDKGLIEDYKNNRDNLRSQSEKERQQVIY
jgi:hypothetical protein